MASGNVRNVPASFPVDGTCLLRELAGSLCSKPMDASDVHGASGMGLYEFDGIQPDRLLEETALEAQHRVIMEGAWLRMTAVL